MITIKEDYVSFETAKLLKEKGFDCKCFDFYEIDYESPIGKHSQRYEPVNWNGEDEENCYSRPNLQMAMKWLREVHNILLFILPAQENGKLVYLVEVWTWDEEEGIYESTYAPMPRKEIEQVVEAAIKYCLENLI